MMAVLLMLVMIIDSPSFDQSSYWLGGIYGCWAQHIYLVFVVVYLSIFVCLRCVFVAPSSDWLSGTHGCWAQHLGRLIGPLGCGHPTLPFKETKLRYASP